MVQKYEIYLKVAPYFTIFIIQDALLLIPALR